MVGDYYCFVDRHHNWYADKHVPGAAAYTWPLELIDTGIVVTPDTQWHSFELTVDLTSQKYISIAIDGASRDVSNVLLAKVYHPDWGEDVSFAITTESTASWPKQGCPNIFSWTMRYKNFELSKVP